LAAGNEFRLRKKGEVSSQTCLFATWLMRQGGKAVRGNPSVELASLLATYAFLSPILRSSKASKKGRSFFPFYNLTTGTL